MSAFELVYIADRYFDTQQIVGNIGMQNTFWSVPTVFHTATKLKVQTLTPTETSRAKTRANSHRNYVTLAVSSWLRFEGFRESRHLDLQLNQCEITSTFSLELMLTSAN